MSSLVAISIYFPTNSARVFHFLHTLSAFIVCRHFDDGHSDWCEVISHCSFDLHFSMKKAECQRIDAFELWYWRRLLRVPGTARSSNQSILKEISPGCSLEGLMLKLKLQYFGPLVQSVDSLEKTLVLGRIGGRKRRG